MSEKNYSRILISIIFFLVLAFIAIGYLAYKNYKLNEKLDNFIEYTNNLVAKDNTKSESQVETVQPVKETESQVEKNQSVKEKDIHSQSTFILNCPLKSDYYISRTYGFYNNPFTNTLELHEGIDFVVKSGTPVYPACDGIITATGWDNVFGTYITISHSNGFKSLYSNLKTIKVKKGETISTKNIIAEVGSTGQSTEPHLGFRLYDLNGNTINPTKYFKELPEPTIPPEKK